MSAETTAPAKFRVGDWVSLEYGPQRVLGQVVEDRGPLGVKGRRLYGLSVTLGDETFPIEVPEDDLKPVTAPSPQEVKEYLKGGGLVTILRANLSGGKHQPRAWLLARLRGGVIHTFTQSRGLVGGKTVPFFALQEDKVFTPKEGEVIDFLKSFRLNDQEAEEVVRYVGTAP
jgi:hypothetical protein